MQGRAVWIGMGPVARALRENRSMAGNHMRKEEGVAVFGHGRGLAASRRERVLVAGVAGLGIFILLAVAAVVNFKSDANARQMRNAAGAFDPSRQLAYALNRPVKAGERISLTNVAQVPWGRNDLPRDAVMVAQELDGMFAKSDIPAGVALSRSMVGSEPAVSSLPVSPGNRAVAIEVDETAGIEGHALPGTRVDIVLTYLENEGLVSKIIVQNARVLSTGGDTRAPGELAQQVQGPRRTARTVTLDVSVKDALEIQTARQLGRLSLIMRAAEDDRAAPILETNRNDISGQKPPAATKPNCRTGRMRSGGKDYIIDCDGGVTEVLSQ